MKYYLHDSNAFNDEKVTELFIKFGYEGLGLFYTILEKLSAQEKPVKTLVLKSQLKVGKKLNKCWEFMESIELISSNNGETFNKQLLNFSEKYKIKKKKNAKRILEWRKNQEDAENVTRSENVCNADKVKKSKVKLSKDIIEESEQIKKLNLWIKINAKNIIGLEEQITDKQLTLLKTKYSIEQISEMLLKMHNWKDLKKKNVSVYLTLNNWLNREYKETNEEIKIKY